MQITIFSVMYILTTEKFESFFRLEADVIRVIRFPHLSRFESDGASADLFFFFMFFQHLQTTAETSLKYVIVFSPPATYRFINNSDNSFSGL
jgi:hypothetical protein